MLRRAGAEHHNGRRNSSNVARETTASGRRLARVHLCWVPARGWSYIVAVVGRCGSSNKQNRCD
jgi:hypothetical protein